MPSRAYTSFLHKILIGLINGKLDLGVNALSGLYLISTERLAVTLYVE